jgi:hypothetical protein
VFGFKLRSQINLCNPLNYHMAYILGQYKDFLRLEKLQSYLQLNYDLYFQVLTVNLPRDE